VSEETIAQRVIRIIAKNKKMALEELCAVTRFDDLKMDSLDALIHRRWKTRPSGQPSLY
jgi:acyl carrier protein